ncbi:MAG: tetratricopeptide repeat protein [Saprospirales bacterium]|nr:tetratricopeptide repeat protein [Saprospirales bacterium]
MEGTQWGGGHAAFTYHLIQGLMGLADENKNDEVTLWEVDKFLSSTVTPEVAPKAQTPFTDGDRNVVLALVDKKTLKQLQKKKEEELPAFDMVDTKGFEMSVIEKASEQTKTAYDGFLRTLKANQLLEPKEDCTDLYYKQLITQPGTESIRNTLTRNFAAALWDSSVDAFNVYIKSDSVRLAEMYKSDPKFSLYPAYLKRASELLDSTHYMYKTLVGTYNYFQGKVKTVEYFETGKPQAVLDEAMANQEKSLEFLEIASSYFELAVANYNNHKIDQAIKYYQKAIELSPTWSQPYDGLGAIYRDMGKYEEARDMYAKALELSPKELLGPAHRNLGYVSYKLKDYASAESNLKEAIQYRPNDPFIYYYLGALYRDTKRPDDAESAFFKTIQLDKSFGAGFYYLGLVYQDQERYADAQSVLETAVKEDPDNTSFLYHLGANHFYQNDFETCMSTMQQVLQLNPSFSEAYYYMAKSLEAMGQPEEAKEAWENAAKKSPKDPEYYYQLGLIQFQKNDFAGADSLLQQSLALDAGNPFTHYYLGMSYYAQKRLKESAFELEKSLALLSDNPDIYYQTGLVYYEMSDFSSAEPKLQKAIALNPDHGQAYFTLGLLYKRTGRAGESATMLEKAKSLGVE